MGRYKKTGLFFGTSGSRQLSFENYEYEDKVKELEKKDEYNRKEFDKNELSYDLSKSKLENYLLNINHPAGGSKAKFFINVMGYSHDKPKQFFDNVSDAINGKKPVKDTTTKYGRVLEFHERIKTISGEYKEVNIVVSIQKDSGAKKYRIITIYPGKKGE